MKNAIVTGASTGIGQAVAVALGRGGFAVYLIARTQQKLEKTKQLITEKGGQAHVICADLSSLESVNDVISQINQMQSVAVLANIAGVWHGDRDVYAGKDFETFDQKVILDTYYVGTIVPTLFAHACIPRMQLGGKIINVSGTFENGAKGWLPYYVSKRAIEDLTIALSQELVGKNIQVNCISPSDTATESYAQFFPQYLDDAISPVKIADKVLELVYADTKLTGQVIVLKKDSQPAEGFHT